MRKPETDEDNVQMSDVLCDFCRQEWTDANPIVEGHRGACICGVCLTASYQAVVRNHPDPLETDFVCRMCRENLDDRTVLDRASEPGWRSPMDPEAFICYRCIKLAAGVLERDSDHNWRRP